MITPGLLRVVYEQQEKELLQKIELKRKVAEAQEREARADGKAPLEDQNHSFLRLLSEKVYTRPSQKSVLRNAPECTTPCLEQG